MGIYIYFLDWVNRNTLFTYLLMSTFRYMDNVQCNVSRFTMGASALHI